MVVPFVIIHREHDVVARVGQQPHVAGLRPLLHVRIRSSSTSPASAITLRPGSSRIVVFSSRCSASAARADSRATRNASASTTARFEIGAEHVALVFGKLIRLRTIAQVVNRNAAAEIDVLERVAGLAMNRDQMLPHAAKGFRERFDVRCLRTDVNVNAANVNQIRDSANRDETPRRTSDDEMPNFEVSKAVCKPRCERVPISGTRRSADACRFWRPTFCLRPVA